MNNNIRELRTKKGYTLVKLSKIVKVDPSHMSRVERGEKKPSIELMMKLSETLDCTMDDIFLRNDLTYRSKEGRYEEQTVKRSNQNHVPNVS